MFDLFTFRLPLCAIFPQRTYGRHALCGKGTYGHNLQSAIGLYSCEVRRLSSYDYHLWNNTLREICLIVARNKVLRTVCSMHYEQQIGRNINTLGPWGGARKRRERTTREWTRRHDVTQVEIAGVNNVARCPLPRFQSPRAESDVRSSISDLRSSTSVLRPSVENSKWP